MVSATLQRHLKPHFAGQNSNGLTLCSNAWGLRKFFFADSNEQSLNNISRLPRSAIFPLKNPDSIVKSGKTAHKFAHQ